MSSEQASPTPVPQLTDDHSPQQRPEARERRSRPRRLVRSLVAGTWANYRSVFETACVAALPWSVWTYPGLWRGLVSILGGRASYRSIEHWRSGRRDPPQWACDLLADYLEGRAAAMASAAATLRSLSHGPKRGEEATRARKVKRRAKAREI
jgi:hypothetical protein